MDPHWFWLLIGEIHSLCAIPLSVDKETLGARLACDEKDEPQVSGQALAYLSPYWQNYHVWMVLDPNWGWDKKQFHALDAAAEEYEAKEPQIVNGGEVKIWTKLEPVDGKGRVTRYGPAENQDLASSSGSRIIRGGWDHEHCEFCRTHIDAGQFGYCDGDRRWTCLKYYEHYMEPHDLAFVDEL